MTSKADGEPTIPRGLLRVAPALLALLAILLVGYGQSRFDLFRSSLNDWPVLQRGLLAFLLAAAALLWGRLLTMRQAEALVERPTAAAKAAHGRVQAAIGSSALPQQARLLGGAALVLLAILLMWLSQLPEPLPSGSPIGGVVMLWLMTIAFAAAAWLRLPDRAAWQALLVWGRARWPWLAALALITLIAALLRLPNLGSVPYTVNGDEGSIALDIHALATGPIRSPFTVMWGTHSMLAGYLLAGMEQLFGPGIGSLRLLGAILGTLTVPALALLGWRVGGRRIGLLAALLLATMPWHIHFSRVMLMVVWDSWSYTTTLALLLVGLSRPTLRWPFVAAGLVAGFGQYAYTGSRLLPLLVIAIVAYLALFHRDLLRRAATGLLAMALVFAAVAGPFYLYGLRFPTLFNQRLNLEGILQNGWLFSEAQIRNQSPLLVLFDQFRRTLFGYAFFTDRSGGWSAGRPMAEPFMSLGLFAGLLFTFRRWRDVRIAVPQLWFWAVVMTAGVLTLNPPTSNRLISTAPVVCLFAVLGWQALTRLLARAASTPYQGLTATVLLLVAILLTAADGTRVSDRTLAESGFGGSNLYGATQISREMPHRPPGTTLILLGNTSLTPDLSTFAYLLGAAPRAYMQPLHGVLPADLPPPPLLFIVTPDRPDDLQTLIAAFPNGQFAPRYNARGEWLYTELMVVGP